MIVFVLLLCLFLVTKILGNPSDGNEQTYNNKGQDYPTVANYVLWRSETKRQSLVLLEYILMALHTAGKCRRSTQSLTTTLLLVS